MTYVWSTLDSLICSQLYFISGYMLPRSSLDYESPWYCQHCQTEMNSATMKTLIATLFDEAENFKEIQVEKIKERIQNWSEILHQNHFLIVLLKKRLLDVFRLTNVPTEDIGEQRAFLRVSVLHCTVHSGSE